MLAPALLEKGNKNLVSDVGVGAQCLASAYRSAWLNVEITHFGGAARRILEAAATVETENTR